MSRNIQILLLIVALLFTVSAAGQGSARDSGAAVTVDGTVSVIHADNFASGTSTTTIFLDTLHSGITPSTPSTLSQQQRYTLTVPPALQDLFSSGTFVRVTGALDGSMIDVTTVQPLAPPEGGDSETLGVYGGAPHRTIAVLVNFRNTYSVSPTQETANDLVFTTASDYYKENSFQREADFNGQTFDWVTIDLDRTCNFSLTEYYAMYKVKEVDPTIDFRNVDHFIVFAPYSCGWGGIATVGTVYTNTPDGYTYMSKASVTTYSSEFTYVTTHEIGHSLGLLHANFYANCSNDYTGCTSIEYGDVYAVLGDHFAPVSDEPGGHLAAPMKDAKVWYNDTQRIESITEPGTYRVEILPTETTDEGVHALKVQRKPGDFVYVEYRQPIGFDADLKYDSIFAGALIHAGWTASYLYDATTPPFTNGDVTLPVGKTFQVPEADIFITTVEATDDHLTVDVVVNGDPPALTLSVDEPTAGSTVDGTVTIAASQNYAFYSPLTFTLDDTVFLSNDTQAPYELTWDSTTIADGEHRITVTGTDLNGEEQSVTAAFIVQNEALPPPPTPLTVSLTQPVDGSTVSGSAVLLEAATTSDAIQSVEFFRDGTSLGSDATAPYSLTWDSTTVANGTIRFTAKAVTGTSSAESSAVTVVVQNLPPPDTTPPVIAITSPTDGAELTPGSIPITASASDESGIASVSFFLDTDTLLAATVAAPYSITWAASAVSGTHTITAKAADGAGNEARHTVSVTFVAAPALAPLADTLSVVQEVPIPADTTPPTLQLSFPQKPVYSDRVPFMVTASDDSGTTSFAFSVDGRRTLSTLSDHGVLRWDSKTVRNGKHTFTFRITDMAGNWAEQTIRLIVKNSLTVGLISSIRQASKGHSMLILTPRIFGGSSIRSVRYVLDDKGTLATRKKASYRLTLDTNRFAIGKHTVMVVVTDVKGSRASAQRSFSVRK